ncbi:hypothetical protein IWW50_000599 [Coemansia erecta]|nr:hypothetical protein IWW50_000599 [Coemansia erecta]
MGLFSFFKKEENYEEILSSLEHDIRQAEKRRIAAKERMEWWAHNWLFYTCLVWLAYLVGFILYVWPNRHTTHAPSFLTHLTLITTIPLFVYYGNVGIRTVCERFIARHDAEIARLRAELRERVDELKKKTAFDSTKTLIDRYSAGEKKGEQEGGVRKDAAARMRAQEAKNRRRTMPNFGTPGSHAAQGAPETSPLAHNTAQRQVSLGQQLPQQQQVAQAVHTGESGVVKVPNLSAQQKPIGGSSAARPWLDKLVDQLVGDVGSERDKYALICRHCFAHNGLVLEEEIREIQYTCPKCHKFNPSLRALSASTALPSVPLQQQSAEAVAAPDSEYGGGEKDGAGSNTHATEREDEEEESRHAEFDTSYDENDYASDDDFAQITTPVTEKRTIRNKPSAEGLEQLFESPPHSRKPSAESLNQPAESASHSRKPSVAKSSPRKRKGAKAKAKRS